jgi:hypothetical protein
MASAALAAVGHHRLLGLVPVSAVFDASLRLGALANRLRGVRGSAVPMRPAHDGAVAHASPAPES